MLFFGNSFSDITHVGIYLGEEQFIHASGFVRINSLNPKNINYSKRQAETFVTARRIKHI